MISSFSLFLNYITNYVICIGFFGIFLRFLLLKAVRQAKAMLALNSMRTKSAKKGYMSEEEISVTDFLEKYGC